MTDVTPECRDVLIRYMVGDFKDVGKENACCEN